uniref:Uncharacterized protein n=1 Tax=Aegilops tauschii TaxID=37682 RepID=M8BV57_AEGTA
MARSSSLALAVAVLAIVCCFMPRSATAIRGIYNSPLFPTDSIVIPLRRRVPIIRRMRMGNPTRDGRASSYMAAERFLNHLHRRHPRRLHAARPCKLWRTHESPLYAAMATLRYDYEF